MRRLGSRAVVEGQGSFLPSVGPCFYILGNFTVDGQGRGDFRSGEEETSVKVMKLATFLLSQQLGCFS